MPCRFNAFFVAVSVLILGSNPASAAELVGNVDQVSIAIGGTAIVSIDLVLDADAGEEASVFEGLFDLVGMGTTGSVVLVTSAVQADWSGSAQGFSGGQGIWSLTSANLGGQRRVAEFAITGLSVGTFDVVLGWGTFAQMDTGSFPFFDDLTISTLMGTNLAQIQVVPEPGTLLLGGLVVSLVALRRRAGVPAINSRGCGRSGA